MNLNGLKKYLNLINISQKAIMKIAIQHVLLRLMFNIFKKMHEIHIDSKLIHNDFPNTMEIEKVEKLLVNLDHKEEYILYIRNLKK